MRKTEREIANRAAIDAVIRRCRVCRLGLTDGVEPYIVPLCFGYDGRALYFHCAREGRKLEILRRNDRVCFEFDIDEGLVEAEQACGWSIRYQSVMGVGRARLVEEPEAQRRALARVMAQYSDRGYTQFPDATLARTAVIEVAIERISGKQSRR